MDPKDLSEHLQSLMEDMAQDLTLREREDWRRPFTNTQIYSAVALPIWAELTLSLIRLKLVRIGSFTSHRGDCLSPNCYESGSEAEPMVVWACVSPPGVNYTT